MSIWLERFDTVDLPLIEAEQDIGAVGTRTTYFDLPGGGAFDAYGSEVAPRGRYTLNATGEIGNLTTQAEMQTQFDALRAKRGRRGKLYARMDDGSVRWVWARLPNIPMTRGVDNVLYLLASLSFDVTSPVWYGDRHGGGWTFDSGAYFDTGLVFDEATGDTRSLSIVGSDNTTINNAGNATITNGRLIFGPGLDTITAIAVTTASPDFTPQSAWSWAGEITVGQSLVFDSGAQSITSETLLFSGAVATDTTLTVDSSDGWVVGRGITVVLTNGSVHRTTIDALPTTTTVTLTDALPSAATAGAVVAMNAYPDLTFNNNEHHIAEWLRFEPGITTVTTTITSASNITMTVEFSDGYE